MLFFPSLLCKLPFKIFNITEYLHASPDLLGDHSFNFSAKNHFVKRWTYVHLLNWRLYPRLNFFFFLKMWGCHLTLVGCVNTWVISFLFFWLYIEPFETLLKTLLFLLFFVFNEWPALSISRNFIFQSVKLSLSKKVIAIWKPKCEIHFAESKKRYKQLFFCKVWKPELSNLYKGLQPFPAVTIFRVRLRIGKTPVNTPVILMYWLVCSKKYWGCTTHQMIHHEISWAQLRHLFWVIVFRLNDFYLILTRVHRTYFGQRVLEHLL